MSTIAAPIEMQTDLQHVHIPKKRYNKCSNYTGSRTGSYHWLPWLKVYNNI